MSWCSNGIVLGYCVFGVAGLCVCVDSICYFLLWEWYGIPFFQEDFESVGVSSYYFDCIVDDYFYKLEFLKICWCSLYIIFSRIWTIWYGCIINKNGRKIINRYISYPLRIYNSHNFLCWMVFSSILRRSRIIRLTDGLNKLIQKSSKSTKIKIDVIDQKKVGAVDPKPNIVRIGHQHQRPLVRKKLISNLSITIQRTQESQHSFHKIQS